MSPGPSDQQRWQTALKEHLSGETATAALRRSRRAENRAEAIVHVPPADAPGRRADGRADRFGQFRSAGRHRRGLPMRAALALWAHGFGAEAVVDIASLLGIDVSSSGIGRLFSQAQRPFTGAEPTRAADLTAELPLPALDPDAPAALATRMKRWRSRYRITKTRAARLAGVTHAMWRRLEAGENTRKRSARNAIERLIDARPPTC